MSISFANPWGDEGQRHIYSEATKLAAAGQEFSHLVALMTPEFCLRLKCFVRDLPDEIRMETIYGRAISKEIPPAKRPKQPSRH